MVVILNSSSSHRISDGDHHVSPHTLIVSLLYLFHRRFQGYRHRLINFLSLPVLSRSEHRPILSVRSTYHSITPQLSSPPDSWFPTDSPSTPGSISSCTANVFRALAWARLAYPESLGFLPSQIVVHLTAGPVTNHVLTAY
jgi:hypothetical protein